MQDDENKDETNSDDYLGIKVLIVVAFFVLIICTLHSCVSLAYDEDDVPGPNDNLKALSSQLYNQVENNAVANIEQLENLNKESNLIVCMVNNYSKHNSKTSTNTLKAALSNIQSTMELLKGELMDKLDLSKKDSNQFSSSNITCADNPSITDVRKYLDSISDNIHSYKNDLLFK